jgi:hypothetical protein
VQFVVVLFCVGVGTGNDEYETDLLYTQDTVSQIFYT